jgi:putative signal transducing protein
VSEEVAVTVVGSEPEAELACRLLQSEDIACYHRPTTYAGGVGDGLVSSWAPREIVVRSEDAGRARELLLNA